jgi:hypothetical protein
MTLLNRRTRSYGITALVGLALLGSACSDSSKSSPVGPGSNTAGTVTTTIPAVVPSGVAGHGWYAAPSGSAAGDGSATKPWDLQTALNGGTGKVQPADTIWLRGGTYSGTFVSSLTGTAAAQITVRQYPKERATLDGGSSSNDILTLNGQYATYWGFEIMSSSTVRTGTAGTGAGIRGDGVYVNAASNVKLINLVVHDVAHGVYTENTTHNVEIYGLVIYDGGYEDGIRSDGHGLYLHNDGLTPKVVRDNVIFNQFGFGIHGYAEATSQEKSLVLDGNVLFNNGTVSSFSNNPNLQVGGNGVADNDSVTNNTLYFSPGVTADLNAKVGYNTLMNGTALVAGNTLLGGTLGLDVGYWQNLTVQGNTLYAQTAVAQHDANAAATEYWSNNQQATGTSAATTVGIRGNRYEAGRATIVIHNGAGQGAVGVDLSGVLKAGAHYEIHNVQDLFGTPVASGTYGGGSVSVPMNGVTPAQIIGGSPRAPVRTGPDFDVFIVTVVA